MTKNLKDTKNKKQAQKKGKTRTATNVTSNYDIERLTTNESHRYDLTKFILCTTTENIKAENILRKKKR